MPSISKFDRIPDNIYIMTKNLSNVEAFTNFFQSWSDFDRCQKNNNCLNNQELITLPILFPRWRQHRSVCAVVVRVVLAANSALPYLAVHASRRHERQPRAREHGHRCPLLRRVGDPRSTRKHHTISKREHYEITNDCKTVTRQNFENGKHNNDNQ